MIAPFWLILTLVSGHTDAAQLVAYADSTGVPPVVVFAVAWQESRSGSRGNAYWGREGERGRMQLHPRGRWRRVLYGNPRCTLLRVTKYYADNVYCACTYLRSLYNEAPSWERAIERYNGSGRYARAYRERALAYVGRLALETLPP